MHVYLTAVLMIYPGTSAVSKEPCTRLIAHAAALQLEGVLLVTNEGRAKLRQLGQEIRVVADFGRPYRCIYNRRRYYTIEDWIAFTETYSLLLLRHGGIFDRKVRLLALLCICTGLPCGKGLQVYGAERERHLSSHTRLIQVLPGHPLAGPKRGKILQ